MKRGRFGFSGSLAVAGACAVGLTACGGRSEPIAGAGLGARIASSCERPVALPLETTRIQGVISGQGEVGSACGNAGGAEDVFSLSVDEVADVRLAFDPEVTEFAPLVHIQLEDCGEALNTLAEPVCQSLPADGELVFTAIPGLEYFVFVDSDVGERGRYAVDVTYDDVPAEACTVHTERVLPEPGGTFRWNNELSSGQGAVDGQCGGAGRENLFPMTLSERTCLRATARGSDGLLPVLTLRRDCAGSSEVACIADVDGTGFVELDGCFDAGDYLVGVDQFTRSGGAYSLEVEFSG